ncbi:hypothetical protein T4A_5227 [Trichinella pseudospiralis]|uniref:Uncharacterized protein n=1 Tax=Trichinella pseudospiralis TaxID=6337 RepID=A0A0V1E706_TRIPS|nr:hypothetical protein T4A_5227 [Trichinella pseudospiralis]
MSTNLSVVIAVALVYTIATLWLMESTIVVVEGQLALVLGHALTTVGWRQLNVTVDSSDDLLFLFTDTDYDLLAAASWCEQLSKEGYTEYRQWKSDITDDETFLVKDCVASDQRPQVYNGSTSVSL